MKVSINWLKELVDLKVSVEELVKLLPLRTIGTKEVTDQYIELDMKGYNRADLLSLRGTALEIAAISDSQISFQDPQDYIWSKELPQVKVEVQDSNLSTVYCIAKIENLKVEPSSKETSQKLLDSGIRSINNIADVTNLVMLEYGQPLHSFDASKVKDETLIVRTAKKGEEIVTLDGKTRKLTTSDLLITDPEKAVGIAGVMGGQNSEITNSSKTILLEAAIFDPVNIRKTATRLGLQSEASKRFQHGLTKKRLLQALDAAIKMYESLGGKLTAITLIGDLEDKTKTVKLSQQKVNSLIGVDITQQQIEDSLNKLGFSLASHIGSGNVNWKVTVPYWRLDINIEEDLIEEVARMYGYEKIPAKELTDNIPNIEEKPLFKAMQTLKQALSDTGLTEVQTYSYYSRNVTVNCQLSTVNLIKVANPISSETEYLRDSLWPNLLEAVAKNIRNGVKDVAIFELGKAYLIKDCLPEEPHRLAIALSNGSSDPISELYQIFQQVSKKMGMEIEVEKETAGEYEKKYFHPTRFSSFYLKGRNIGGIAEIHPRIVNKFGIDQRVVVLEVEINF